MGKFHANDLMPYQHVDSSPIRRKQPFSLCPFVLIRDSHVSTQRGRAPLSSMPVYASSLPSTLPSLTVTASQSLFLKSKNYGGPAIACQSVMRKWPCLIHVSQALWRQRTSEPDQLILAGKHSNTVHPANCPSPGVQNIWHRQKKIGHQGATHQWTAAPQMMRAR